MNFRSEKLNVADHIFHSCVLLEKYSHYYTSQGLCEVLRNLSNGINEFHYKE